MNLHRLAAAGCLIVAAAQLVQAAAAFPSLTWPTSIDQPRPWPLYVISGCAYIGWAVAASRRRPL